MLRSTITCTVVVLIINTGSFGFTGNGGSYDTTRPDFPPEDQIKEMKNREAVVSYPHFTVNLGLALRKLSTSALEATYRQFEERLGASRGSTFEESKISSDIGSRVHFSKTIAIWLQYKSTGVSDDRQPTSDINDGLDFSTVSLSILYSIFNPQGRVALSFGIGIASQKFEAKRTYSQMINDDTKLDDITVITKRHSAVPVTILLDFPRPDQSRVTFQLGAQYMIAPNINLSHVYGLYGFGTNPNLKYELEAHGISISAGLSFAL